MGEEVGLLFLPPAFPRPILVLVLVGVGTEPLPCPGDEVYDFGEGDVPRGGRDEKGEWLLALEIPNCDPGGCAEGRGAVSSAGRKGAAGGAVAEMAGTDGVAAAEGGGIVEGTTTEGALEGVLEGVWEGHWPKLALPPLAFIIIRTGKVPSIQRRAHVPASRSDPSYRE